MKPSLLKALESIPLDPPHARWGWFGGKGSPTGYSAWPIECHAEIVEALRVAYGGRVPHWLMVHDLTQLASEARGMGRLGQRDDGSWFEEGSGSAAFPSINELAARWGWPAELIADMAADGAKTWSHIGAPIDRLLLEYRAETAEAKLRELDLFEASPDALGATLGLPVRCTECRRPVAKAGDTMCPRCLADEERERA